MWLILIFPEERCEVIHPYTELHTCWLGSWYNNLCWEKGSVTKCIWNTSYHTHVAAFSFQILQKQIMQIIIKNVRNRSKILALDGFQNPKFGWVPVNFSKILLLQPYMMLPLLLWCTSIFFLKASGAAVPERKMKWKRHQKSGFHSRQHFTIAVTECGFLDVICRVPWNSV